MSLLLFVCMHCFMFSQASHVPDLSTAVYACVSVFCSRLIWCNVGQRGQSVAIVPVICVTILHSIVPQGRILAQYVI